MSHDLAVMRAPSNCYTNAGRLQRSRRNAALPHHQGQEVLDLPLSVDPAQVHLLTGGPMKAELSGLTVQVAGA